MTGEELLKEAIYWMVVAGLPTALWLGLVIGAFTTPLPDRPGKRGS